MSCQRLLTLLAGSRPAASHFFLCEQEKLTKKKSPPLSAPPRCCVGEPPVLGFGGVWLNSPAAQTTPALIRQILRSSAHTEGGEAGSNTGDAQRTVTVASAATRPGTLTPTSPSGCAEERKVRRIRASSCLSAASSAGPSRSGAPQVARSASAGSQTAGRFLFR